MTARTHRTAAAQLGLASARLPGGNMSLRSMHSTPVLSALVQVPSRLSTVFCSPDQVTRKVAEKGSMGFFAEVRQSL
jgi:hypothetical protein